MAAWTIFSEGALVLLADWKHYIFGPLMFLTAVFLILLVLVQRGRGGGLTGALGGMGGQSAFGTKAGDVFTRVTMVTAAIWILLCMLAIKVLAPLPSRSRAPGGFVTGSQPATDQSGDEGAAGTDEDRSGPSAPEASGEPSDSASGDTGAAQGGKETTGTDEGQGRGGDDP